MSEQKTTEPLNLAHLGRLARALVEAEQRLEREPPNQDACDAHEAAFLAFQEACDPSVAAVFLALLEALRWYRAELKRALGQMDDGQSCDGPETYNAIKWALARLDAAVTLSDATVRLPQGE